MELSKVNSYKAFSKSAQHITYIFFLANQQALVRDLMYKSILSSISPLKYLRELKEDNRSFRPGYFAPYFRVI